MAKGKDRSREFGVEEGGRLCGQTDFSLYLQEGKFRRGDFLFSDYSMYSLELLMGT